MILLEAINIVIRGTSKATINDLDDQSQEASLARRTIRESRTEILSHGWRFNTRKTSLAVNIEGRVPVSATYLSVKFKTGNDHFIVQERDQDNKLYVWDEDTDDWHNEAMANVTIIFDKAGDDPSKEDDTFRNFPAKLARWIAFHARSNFFQEINAVESSDLLKHALRAQASWVNTQVSTNLSRVSGFAGIRASGHGGGGRGNFDPRTQSNVF